MSILSRETKNAIENNNISYFESVITNNNVNDCDGSGRTALIHAADNGKLEIVQLLLDKGANINYSSYIGGTSLLYAAGSGYLDIVQLLLDEGADINLSNNNGDTSLIIAAKYKNIEVVKLLIRKGANTSIVNKVIIPIKAIILG